MDPITALDRPAPPTLAAPPADAPVQPPRRHPRPAGVPEAMCRMHLDFHTSGHIPGVGAAFDADRFADRLVHAGIESVTLFARCHHSLCYYPTRLGTPHPTLPRDADDLPIDLLGRQMDACRARGIRCPVYLAVGWSEGDAERRPDWVVRTPDGRPVISADVQPQQLADARAPRPHVAWSFLDVGDGGVDSYGKHVLDLVAELCERYPLDGLFLDICQPRTNAAAADPTLAGACDRWLRWARRVERALHAAHPAATLFFNGLAEADTPAGFLDLQSHLEIEDLPSFWGGYDRFPVRVRALHGRPEARGKTFVAMSGRFHTMWGEFGGYKHPQAMRLEALTMIANGCRCSFGDQLPPSGELDTEGLRRIAPAMSAVAAMRPYVEGAVPVSSLAICREPTAGTAAPNADSPIQGIGQVLLERHREFVVIPPDALDAAPSPLRTVIVCEAVSIAGVRRIEAFVRAGGCALLIGPEAIDSALAAQLDCGVARADHAVMDVDYLRIGDHLRRLAVGVALDTAGQPVLCYQPAAPLAARGAEVLAEVVDPYFSRSVGKYCSHRHTPPDPAAPPRPAITVRRLGAGRVYCLGHRWGELYRAWGMRLHRDVLAAVLLDADPAPTIEAQLPSTARVSLLRQDAQRRHLLHITYAPPIKRGCVEVLEDFPELRGAAVTLNLHPRPARAQVIADGHADDLALHPRPDGRVHLKLPPVVGHLAVVLDDA